MKPPNYRLGTKKRQCGTCGAFRGGRLRPPAKRGICIMFEVFVQRDKVCDKWYAK